MIRALGIDPGSRFTGYGVVETDGTVLRHVASGVIRIPPSLPVPERLKVIYDGVCGVIREEAPECLAVEEVFFAKNVRSALVLGHARGAAVLAAVNGGLPVFEYSALAVKQAVVGYGKAGKEQVSLMVRTLFGLREALDPNAADALAIAVCHLNTQASRTRWKLPGAKS